MLSSGDVVNLDLGAPHGREAGFLRPAIVVTAQRILDADPSVLHVVPVTSTIRGFGSDVPIGPDEANGLAQVSAAQCQHIRALSPGRVREVRGNIGAVPLAQIRQVLSLLFDLT